MCDIIPHDIQFKLFKSDINDYVITVPLYGTENICHDINTIMTKLFDGVDVNMLHSTILIRQCFMKYHMKIYYTVNACFEQRVEEILSRFASNLNNSTNSQFYNNARDTLFTHINKLPLVKKIMSTVDYQVNKHYSLTEYIFLNHLTNLLSSKLPNGLSILQELDNHLDSRDLNCLGSLSKIIYMMLKYYNGNSSKLKEISCHLKNTLHLFLSKIHLLSLDVVEIFIYLFEHDDDFIIVYKKYLAIRLETVCYEYELENEKKLLTRIDHNPITEKYIGFMMVMISDIQRSITMSSLLTNIRVAKKETLQTIPVVNAINLSHLRSVDSIIPSKLPECRVIFKHRFAWDLSQKENYIFENNASVQVTSLTSELYTNVISTYLKLLSQTNTNSCTHAYPASTCIVNMTINDNDYQFLTTLEQCIVLERLTQKEINRNEQVNERLISILDGLCVSELVTRVGDTYYLNQNFFSTNNKISIIELEENVIDEEIVVNILDLLSNQPLSLQQVVDVYEKEYCMTNYELISSVMEYLEKNSLVIKKDGDIPQNTVYSVNNSLIDDTRC